MSGKSAVTKTPIITVGQGWTLVFDQMGTGVLHYTSPDGLKHRDITFALIHSIRDNTVTGETSRGGIVEVDVSQPPRFTEDSDYEWQTY